MSFRNAQLVCKSADAGKYHGDNKPRGDKDFVVSSSMLRLFAQCPSRWRQGYTSPESDAKQFGSLLDTRLLSPESFEARFSRKPAAYPDSKTGEPKPWNGNALFCHEWVEAQEGKVIVSGADMAECDTAIKRLRSDETISAWIDACDYQVWVQAEWVDKKTGLMIPVKALLDFVPRLESEFSKCLGDLKCVRSGGLNAFQRQVYQLGWHVQAAFYQDIYIAATGEDRTDYIFVGVENYPPFEPLRRLLAQNFLQIGKQTYQSTLARYCACLKSGVWPGYDDHADSVQGWSLIEPLPWMDFEAVSDAMRQTQEEALEQTNDIIP